MSFRIVILNGISRGERFEIERSAITIGKNATCDIVLPEPGISDTHAILTPKTEDLLISTTDPQQHLIVNKTVCHETLLKHGDVIEIGTTRLFVQHHRDQAWETLTGYRKWRKWLTLILPLLLTSLIGLSLYHFRNTAPPPIEADKLPNAYRPQNVPDPSFNDWVVTNIPQIQIHSTVVLSSAPPDIVDARELFIQIRTNSTQQEIDIALKELDFATTFLETEKANSAPVFIPDTQASQALLQQAESSLSLDGLTRAMSTEATNTFSISTDSTSTNPDPGDGIFQATPIQTDRLTN
jgi:hypothetical protein